ncbi:MAG: N-6 DNA methylase [Candidatus Diapherotrites archaeon]|nr:N-6 DNA methylase [Candidatus Diapherotrites archaeon]
MYSKEEARLKIRELVDEFLKYPERDSLNEQEIKAKFVQPLFEFLNWDFRSSDVKLEEKVSNGRVDYSFRINNIPKCFIEAKRPSANVDSDEIINQAKNYAWHKATTWAVVTNFKRIVIYNALIKEGVMASRLRNIYLTEINDFDSNFEGLWLLSKNSFDTDIIDKVAEKECKKMKLVPVEKKLFEDLNNWRQLIAKDIAKNYPGKYSAEELDEIIQVLLDRFILIKKIEDTNLEGQKLHEAYNSWSSQQKKNLDTYVKEVFEYYKKDYDSGIFDTKEIDNVKISDPALQVVIEELYSVRNNAIEYDFGIIDADVLGNIYEQYLGYLLKTTAKRVKGTASKAKRKEQGIYYTPRHIVDYIVKNTLGEKLKECKTWEDVEKIKVLDPACGSGSFLIRAFDEINNWYGEKGFDQNKLTMNEESFETIKDKIIKKNLFGVDLDQKAVELAQLNLLLKTADKKHKLPTLQQNIKCGNSLIDEEKIAGTKAFKWEKEFEEVMNQGGFDVVIGNPPYVSIESLEFNQRRNFEKLFESAVGRFDLFMLFIEKALILLKEGGYLSFIIPNKFLTNDQSKKLRQILLKTGSVLTIVTSTDKVFESANVSNIIFVFQKNSDAKKCQIVELKNQKMNSRGYVDLKLFSDDRDFKFVLTVEQNTQKILSKIASNTKKLGELAEIKDGIVAGRLKDILFLKTKTNQNIKPLLFGRNINRYSLTFSNDFVDYRKNFMNKQEELRAKGKRPGLWLREEKIFERPKILSRQTANKIIATFDDKNFYYEHTLHSTYVKDKNYSPLYILGILNSKLLDFYYQKFINQKGALFPQIRLSFLSNLPIKIASKFEQQAIDKLVTKILSLNKRLNELNGKQTSAHQKVEEDIKRTDAEIDELVYQLYGITEEEKKIIEEAI